jgi:hypothetical protein
MVKFLLASALAALVSAGGGPYNDITATCNDDNTITVNIRYENHAVDILSAEYGSCNITDINRANESNQTSYEFTLEPAACDMEGKLRELQYNQTASFVAGRKDGDTEIVFATFEVDSYCAYTSEYTVTFDYGPVDATNYDFDTSGGLIELDFYITSMNSAFSGEATPSTTAGDTIYLKLQLNRTQNGDFDDADSEDASSGKLFVPTKCYVNDGSVNYTLFDANATPTKCENDFIDLDISYNRGSDQSWEISHTLFLLDDETSSSYTLSCNVLVCDMSQGSACKTAVDCLV